MITLIVNGRRVSVERGTRTTAEETQSTVMLWAADSTGLTP